MVPGKFINLLPPQITKPKVSAVGRAPAVPVPSSAVPKFTKPDLLIPDNFWSNLKQFLTECPVKVRERKDAPFTQTNFGSGLAGNLAEFLRPGRESRGRVKRKLALAWAANLGGSATGLGAFFSLQRKPRRPLGIGRVKVKATWPKD